MNNPPEVWVKVCRELEKVISPDALNRWFSSILPLSYDSGRLVLGVENKNGNHGSSGLGRAMQRGVVGNTQVAAKPDDHGRRGHKFFSSAAGAGGTRKHFAG